MLRVLAMGVGSLANGSSDSQALRASGRATRIEILSFDWSETETASRVAGVSRENTADGHCITPSYFSLTTG